MTLHLFTGQCLYSHYYYHLVAYNRLSPVSELDMEYHSATLRGCVPSSDLSELPTVDSQLLRGCRGCVVYSLWLSIAFGGSSTQLLPAESNLVHTRSGKGEAQVSLALVYGLCFTAVWEVYCTLCSHSTGLEWVSSPQRGAVMCSGRETAHFPQPLTSKRNKWKSDAETQKAMVLNYRDLVDGSYQILRQMFIRHEIDSAQDLEEPQNYNYTPGGFCTSN